MKAYVSSTAIFTAQHTGVCESNINYYTSIYAGFHTHAHILVDCFFMRLGKTDTSRAFHVIISHWSGKRKISKTTS